MFSKSENNIFQVRKRVFLHQKHSFSDIKTTMKRERQDSVGRNNAQNFANSDIMLTFAH